MPSYFGYIQFLFFVCFVSLRQYLSRSERQQAGRHTASLALASGTVLLILPMLRCAAAAVAAAIDAQLSDSKSKHLTLAQFGSSINFAAEYEKASTLNLSASSQRADKLHRSWD